MSRSQRFLPAIAAACAAALLLTSCGSSESGNVASAAGADAGDPVAGGVLRAIQMGEPRSLDPAALSNTWAHQPVLGNALYGTLMINNLDTLEVEYKMASDFSTTDGGATFDLVLRPGLTFTDGTPLDAAAVKFNWDRLRDPALGSTAIRQAAQVASSEVVDPTTLRITLASPNPHFPQGMLTTSMNWIASPAALQKGPAEFDRTPVGAGPFTLKNWMRGDAVELVKNPQYWDAPKPYLDELTVRTVADNSQRFNMMSSGGADLSLEASWGTLAKAEAAGIPSEVVPAGGGQIMIMNSARAPFDDVRARRAVSLATDLDALNSVVFNGEGETPETLFPEGSPYFADIPLWKGDKETAQKLFDELAAEGKPVSFTFMSYPTQETKAAAESLQAQLAAFQNVNVEVQVVDYAAATARVGARDFDMVISSAITQDPDYALWTAFHGDSPGNFSGLDDAELNDALDAGRIAQTVEERKAAYETAQNRLVDLVPGVWYTKAAPSVMYGENVHGVRMFTLGSPMPEEMWMTN